MFTVEALPAQRGDCLWITYGTRTDPHHVIIDAGPRETLTTLVPELEARIGALPGTGTKVELLVISHIDADHIQGVVSLLSDSRRLRRFGDVWFNGYEHLGPQMLGAVDGERLTAALQRTPTRWNKAFKGKAVVVPPGGALPVRTLPGGLRLTVLSPHPDTLAALEPTWEKECRKAGITEGKGATPPRSWQREGLLGFDPAALASTRYQRDTGLPNATSITLIAEYQGKRALLLADAPAEQVLAGLDRLGPGVQRFDLVKMAHHGSRRNTSPELLARIRSRRWVVSTNGAVFGHPDPEALARVITSQPKPTFYFNYVTDHIADVVSAAGEGFQVALPSRDPATFDYSEGIRVSVV